MEFQTAERGDVLTVWPVENDVVMINKGSDWTRSIKIYVYCGNGEIT